MTGMQEIVNSDTNFYLLQNMYMGLLMVLRKLISDPSTMEVFKSSLWVQN